jgi:putative photosynthetic complex assembly protein 2
MGATMTGFGFLAGYAVFVWWFSTGVILFLDRLPRRTFRWSLAAATVLLLAALYWMRASAFALSSGAAFSGFTCAIVVWGWLEMSFLMGYITGPRKHACAERCAGWRHFLHASQTVIHNEIATAAGAGCVLAVTWQAPNRVALGTYLILWGMRLSAKLNLFLGVPNLGETLLPAHLGYLRSFFKRRSMNMLFPFSIIVSTTLAVILGRRYMTAEDAFHITAYGLLTSLLALGVLEHWFMVVPLPSEKLWNWARRPARTVSP